MIFIFYVINIHVKYFEDYLATITNKMKSFGISFKIIHFELNDIIDITEEDTHIFFQQLPPSILQNNELNNSDKNYNIYVLNTEQLKIRNQHILNYPIKINYIDWSPCNIPYYSSCPESSIDLLSYQVNYDEIFNNPKSKDVCMFVSRYSEYREKIFNRCRDVHPTITAIAGFGKKRDELLFQHKILINASLEPDCSVLEQFRVNRCIYNRMIIISDKKEDSDMDFILNKYIIYVDYLDIPNKVLDVLNRYQEIYDQIYRNFDNELPLIDEYFTKQIKSFIS